jgi:IS5 family transposase
MPKTKEGHQWYYGMNIYIGLVKVSGLIHAIDITATNLHGLTQSATLLHCGE